MSFSSPLQSQTSSVSADALQALPRSLAQVAPSTLLSQLQIEESIPEEKGALAEHVTLQLTADVSVGLLGTDVPILSESLFLARGPVEVLASFCGQFLEFRYNRLSGSGEEYPMRLLLHGGAL